MVERIDLKFIPKIKLHVTKINWKFLSFTEIFKIVLAINPELVGRVYFTLYKEILITYVIYILVYFTQVTWKSRKILNGLYITDRYVRFFRSYQRMLKKKCHFKERFVRWQLRSTSIYMILIFLKKKLLTFSLVNFLFQQKTKE